MVGKVKFLYFFRMVSWAVKAIESFMQRIFIYIQNFGHIDYFYIQETDVQNVNGFQSVVLECYLSLMERLRIKVSEIWTFVSLFYCVLHTFKKTFQ